MKQENSEVGKKVFADGLDPSSRPLVLVLELKMSVLRIAILYFYRTSLQTKKWAIFSKHKNEYAKRISIYFVR